MGDTDSDSISDLSILDTISNTTNSGDLDEISSIDDEEVDSCPQTNNARKQGVIFQAITIGAAVYHKNYVSKIPCRVRPYSGWAFLLSMINGRDIRSRQNLRMSKEVFFNLCRTLVDDYGLKQARAVTVEEQVATFLMIVGTLEGNRQLQEHLQRSGFTITRSFHRVLKACTKMALDWIQPSHNYTETHPYIRDNPRYYPHFKDCIGAIDGTHIKARLPVADQVPFIGRKNYPTQNCMVACDFDMCFTFVLPGWEGSAHDTRIFFDTIRDSSKGFPMPPPGKYYMVDAGYPNITGFLAPYKGEKYHLPDFQRAPSYNNHLEMYNHLHSSLRTTIERTFGCWKSKFQIMDTMPVNIKWRDQIALVPATMAIHNFIRKNDPLDEDFLEFECDPENLPCTEETNSDNASRHGPEVDQVDQQMNSVRDGICTSIAFTRIGVSI